MTPVLMAVCLLAGIGVGLLAGAKWRRSLRQQLTEERNRVDMWNKAGANTLLDEVGPATPKPRFHDIDPDEPFDDAELLGPDQLAEMRTYSLDEVIAEHGFSQAEIDAADDGPDYAGWAQGISHDPTVRHVGQACGWNFDDDTVCGDPAEGWSQWPDGEVVWLCATHFQWVRPSEDDTGPRSVPGPRVSD